MPPTPSRRWGSPDTAAPRADAPPALAPLASALHRERALVRLLALELGELCRAISAGDAATERRATGEVARVAAVVRAAGLERALSASAWGAFHGVGDEPALRDVVAAAAWPWRVVLFQAGEALREAVDELDAAADAVRRCAAERPGARAADADCAADAAALPSVADFLG